MEGGVSELLFELGSEDRLRILSEIETSPLKQGQLAQKLSMTIQEMSRQCGRLEQVGLVEKHVDGAYGLSAIGNICLTLLPSFELLVSESAYFKSHDALSLPPIFLERIGELFEHQSLDHLDKALKLQSRIVGEGKEYIYFMSDQAVGHYLHEDHSNYSKDVVLKILLPKNVDTGAFRAAKNVMGSRLQIGLLDQVKIVIALNEKIGAIALPTLDGRPDYTRGLFGESLSFVSWCRDLFSYYWDRSLRKYPTEN
jgi:predicted transcriptional regulator